MESEDSRQKDQSGRIQKKWEKVVVSEDEGGQGECIAPKEIRRVGPLE